MARRNEGFLDLIVLLPWWVGVIFAGLVYAVMRYWVPGWLDDSPFTAALGQVSYGFAPYGAGLTLVAAAISGVRSLLGFLFGDRDRSASPRTSRPSAARLGSPVTQRSAPQAAAQPRVPADRRPVATTSRTCPRCGADLVIRRASRGANAGSDFWGCSSYPQCRHTEDITK